jgi:excinuclease UvrABC nuclease subunit
VDHQVPQVEKHSSITQEKEEVFGRYVPWEQAQVLNSSERIFFYRTVFEAHNKRESLGTEVFVNVSS